MSSHEVKEGDKALLVKGEGDSTPPASSTSPAPAPAPLGDPTISYVDATAEDAPFLAKAQLLAERAGGDHGLWDHVFKGWSEDLVLRTLEWDVLHNEDSPFYFKRFKVAKIDGKVVGAATGYKSPDTHLGRMEAGVREGALKAKPDLSSEDFDAIWSRMGFLGSAFPADVDYDNVYVIESVYTEPSCRGKGVATTLITLLEAEGQKIACKATNICAYLGNHGAFKVYERLGYKVMGDGDSDACFEALKVRGFRVFVKPN